MSRDSLTYPIYTPTKTFPILYFFFFRDSDAYDMFIIGMFYRFANNTHVM